MQEELQSICYGLKEKLPSGRCRLLEWCGRLEGGVDVWRAVWAFGGWCGRLEGGVDIYRVLGQRYSDVSHLHPFVLLLCFY